MEGPKQMTFGMCEEGVYMGDELGEGWGSRRILRIRGHFKGSLPKIFQGTSGAFWSIPGGGALRFGGHDWKISKAIAGMGVGGRENSWDV